MTRTALRFAIVRILHSGHGSINAGRAAIATPANKVLGEELGLTITQHPQIGSLTELAPGTSEEYADELEELAAALIAYQLRRRPPAEERPGAGLRVPQAPQAPRLGRGRRARSDLVWSLRG